VRTRVQLGVKDLCQHVRVVCGARWFQNGDGITRFSYACCRRVWVGSSCRRTCGIPIRRRPMLMQI